MLFENRTTICKAFELLEAKAVKEYLLNFLNLDVDKTVQGKEGLNLCVIGHVSKWLRGHP